MRVRMLFVVVGIMSLLAHGPAHGQTASLPPPAASSLDRLAQVPVSPPPPAWDPYGSQALPTYAPPAGNAGWAPSGISGQPGYPGYSPAAPSLVPPGAAPPFAPPGTQPPPGAYTPAGYPAPSSTFDQTMQQTYSQTMHVFQGVRGSWAYLMGDGSGTRVGVNELDTTATFALPFFHNSPANINHAPLLITPGFGLQLWNGPQTSATLLADLPPNTYDVFLDTAWNPQFTPLFGAELGVRVGIFTNWDVIVADSFRIMGRAIGTLQMTPTWQAKAGVIYLDRNQVKILPALGATWTPDATSRYDIFFPAPKAAKQFAANEKRAWWGYVSGEYGGGAWTFRRNTSNYNMITGFDYNDIRIALGTELVPMSKTGLAGNFEVGYVFYRQLYYVEGPPQIQNLPDTIMFRFGLSY